MKFSESTKLLWDLIRKDYSDFPYNSWGERLRDDITRILIIVFFPVLVVIIKLAHDLKEKKNEPVPKK